MFVALCSAIASQLAKNLTVPQTIEETNDKVNAFFSMKPCRGRKCKVKPYSDCSETLCTEKCEDLPLTPNCKENCRKGAKEYEMIGCEHLLRPNMTQTVC